MPKKKGGRKPPSPTHNVVVPSVHKMAAATRVAKKRIPKIGDRVAVLGEKGTFVVTSVDSAIEDVEVRMIGRDFALDAIPWAVLTYLDELDESQNALRVVREATDDK